MGSFIGFLVLLPKYLGHFGEQGTLAKPQRQRRWTEELGK